MSLWEATSTKIKAGESVQSSSYAYDILKELNDGKMAVAYHAKRSDGLDIFLKHTKDPNEYNDQYADYVNAQHEILPILNKIGEADVEKNYEYFEYKGRHFQAKEFLKGSDLKAKIWAKNQSDRMSFDVRIEVVERLAFIVQQIHDHGIIHSDLKPEQVFIVDDSSTKTGFRLKLIDFDHSIVPAANIYLPAGTPTWYSPEHNREDEKVGAYSDIFTLGNMFYTILTGGLKPYADYVESDAKYRSAITKTNSVKTLDTLMPGFPVEISDLVKRMLHPNHEKRPPAKDVYSVLIDFKTSLEKPKFIKIYQGEKSRLITESIKFTRAMAKSSFGNYQDIYSNQFEIIKDKNSDWFIKGLPVPKGAKSKSGEMLNFYPTKIDGKDITNKILPIEDGLTIAVGATELTIKTKN